MSQTLDSTSLCHRLDFYKPDRTSQRFTMAGIQRAARRDSLASVGSPS
jgi:hypothetical protein